MVTYDLGKVVGDKGAKGDKGDKGDAGAAGNGISSIALISTSGKTKTYRISYTNGSHFDFNVVDGNDGSSDIVTSWESTLSDSKVPSEKLVKNGLDNKADTNHSHGNLKSDGSVGSSNNTLKNVVTDSNGKITTEAKPTIPSKISDLTNDSDFIETSSTTGLVKNDGSIDTTSYSTFSGDYDDLTDKPSIPSSSSDLSDGASLVKTSSTTGLLKNDGSVMTSGTGSSNWAVGNHTHSGYVSATKVTSWSSTTSDSNVPSEKLVKDTFDDIEDLIGDAITYINQ